MNNSSDNLVPLCVDLDGTLVKSDMLVESALKLLRQDPLSIFKMPLWLLKGKANLKHQIASRVDMSQVEVPYHAEVLDYVKLQRSNRKTVLVTGSHQSIADAIAKQTDAFDIAQGSSEAINLTGDNKRQWLVDQFGSNGFDYIGNDSDDLRVWPEAKESLLVEEGHNRFKFPSIEFSKVFQGSKASFKDCLKLVRAHQWSKNLLILVPFVLDHRIGSWEGAGLVMLAFVAMCLLASITYIFNDMLDLQADRLHEYKKQRPLASGAISLKRAVLCMGGLAAMLLVAMSFLPALFNYILLAYLALTLLYSFRLKQIVILDVCVIATLHTLRIIGGAAAIGAERSFWLLAFSMFIFFSLAMAKRVAELKNLEAQQKEMPIGRGYKVSDLPVLISTGTATGFLSVLIVALYIESEKVQTLYHASELLWLICPILMYWIGRLWMITGRGEMHEDPILFALRDKASLVVFVTGCIVIAAATVL